MDHTAAALHYLLFDTKAPAVPLAIFLYRDYAISAQAANHIPFLMEFKTEFGFAGSDEREARFEQLFDTKADYLGEEPIADYQDAAGLTP